MIKNIIIAMLIATTVFFGIGDYMASHGDLDKNGKVDARDFSILASHYNEKLHGLKYRR